MQKGKYLLIIIVAVALVFSFDFARTVEAFLLGPSFAGTGIDDATDGTFVWTSPGNVTAEDGTMATVVSGAANGTTHSHYLKATGFNFSLPNNATITGVTVDVDRQDGGFPQTPHDAHVYLVKGGVIQTSTTDQANLGLFWPAALTYATYGSTTDLWGNTLAPSDVNNSGFGVAINITGSSGGGGSKYGGNIDAIRIAVSYTTPGFRTMSSNSYAVQADSINFAGGLSSSASYAVQDTAGEIGSGVSTSTNYQVNAGYQQMFQSYIALSPPAATSTLPSVSGLVGGASLSSSTWVVTTDNSAGYALSISASQSPAMQGDHGDNVADYVPVAGSVPDFDFTILPSQSAFGFSSYGADASARFLNNSSVCGVGVFNTLNNCWDGFSTSPKVIAQGLNSNVPSGASTTAIYQVQIGSARNQTAGSYSATITVTAVTL